MSESLPTLLRRAVAIRENGGSVIACMLVKARGSTPQAAGSLMIVGDALQMHGTVGGGCVEAEIRRLAHRMLREGQNGVQRFKLDHDYGWDDGLICGGTIEVGIGGLPASEELESIAKAVEAREATQLPVDVTIDDAPHRFVLDLPPRPRLYIAGAGHIGASLARLALDLDFSVTLFDDREDLLERAAPDGASACSGEIAATLHAAPVDDATYIVVVTRGHRHDERALEASLGRGARYVGMIGSRRKVKLIFDDLRERGIEDDELARVHAPVGLDIGSVLVNEIALSIAAQLVKVRREERIRPVSGPYPVVGAGVAAGS